MGLRDMSVQSFGTARDMLIRLPLKAAQGESQNVAMQKQTDGLFAGLTSVPAPGEASECAAMHQAYRELIATGLASRPRDKIEALSRRRAERARECRELTR